MTSFEVGRVPVVVTSRLQFLKGKDCFESEEVKFAVHALMADKGLRVEIRRRWTLI